METTPPVNRSRSDQLVVDVFLRQFRWAGVTLIVVQFWLYTTPTGVTMPFARAWGAVPVALLVGLNAVSLWRSGSASARAVDLDPGRPPVFALVQLAADTLVVALLVGMFAFDYTSALWALLAIPVLEAAVRGWARGAVAVHIVQCAVFALGELVVVRVWPGHHPSLDAVTFRVGFLTLVTVTRLVHRLNRQMSQSVQLLAEATALRRLAEAGRAMASLDESVVVREVVRAALGWGLLDPHLLGPGGPWRTGSPPPTRHPAVSDYTTALAVHTASRGTETDAFTVAEVAGRLVAVVPFTAAPAGAAQPDALEGPPEPWLLVAGLPAAPSPVLPEAFGLLAAQACAALTNARRYAQGRRLEALLAHDAAHDRLTGLATRALLHRRCEALLEAPAPAPAPGETALDHVAVVCLDVDRFAEVNDALGHGAGDRLLVLVAERLARVVRPGETCARTGGDEFAVLAGAVDGADGALEVARRVRHAVAAPFAVDGLRLDLEATVGVAWGRRGAARPALAIGEAMTVAGATTVDLRDPAIPALDGEELLRRADVARHTAKGRRESLGVYAAVDDAASTRHLAVLGELRAALESRDQLTLDVQPLVGAADGRLVAVEALLRWHHPERGDVPPDSVIPVAERSAVIHPLTDRVLGLAFSALAQWRATGLSPRIAVNLSARTLLDVSLPGRIQAQLERLEIEPSLLGLEITESAIMADPTRSIATLQRLADLGVVLSIDDFGTGYSSMGYLKDLPVREVKIDRCFVSDLARSPRDVALVRSVVDLAHGLGLQVVAEGVEDGETLALLADLGCELVQGYFVGRPMPVDELAGWVAGRPAIVG